MLPLETQRLIEEHGIRYVLAQFVDIHGAAKTKSVPICGLEAVAEAGAGFAGFAISGMGMQPNGPDFMAKADLSTLTPVPWQPGYGRVVCIGHVDGKGLVAGLACVRPGPKDPDSDLAWDVIRRSIEKGVLMFSPVGFGGGTVKICPPLVITEDAIFESVAAFEKAFAEAVAVQKGATA